MNLNCNSITMNRDKYRWVLLYILILVTLLSTVIVTYGADRDTPESTKIQDLIKEADRVAREARTVTRTRDRLEDAIELYHDVLEVDPDNHNRHALNRLSLGYFTLAEAYLAGTERKKTAYRTGYEYGLKSLKLNKDFAESYEKKGFKALKNLPSSVDNGEAVFWTGANLGRLGETKGVLDSLGDLPALVELNRRAIALNEAYLGGAAHRALGSIAGELLSRQPITFLIVHNNGFSWEKVKNHFEKALEIAPGCLENYFSYAKYYALKKGKKDMARDLLNETLTRPLGGEYPLINSIAKKKARELKEEKF